MTTQNRQKSKQTKSMKVVSSTSKYRKLFKIKISTFPLVLYPKSVVMAIGRVVVLRPVFGRPPPPLTVGPLFS